jgi:hypothetical protein
MQTTARTARAASGSSSGPASTLHGTSAHVGRAPLEVHGGGLVREPRAKDRANLAARFLEECVRARADTQKPWGHERAERGCAHEGVQVRKRAGSTTWLNTLSRANPGSVPVHAAYSATSGCPFTDAHACTQARTFGTHVRYNSASSNVMSVFLHARSAACACTEGRTHVRRRRRRDQERKCAIGGNLRL